MPETLSILETHAWLVPVFFVVAVFYSAAGFGGGSSYLAFLSMATAEQQLVRSIAYLCNISVTSLSSYRFMKRGWLLWKDAWPLLVGSVPFAFLGGSIRLGNHAYFILLGAALLVVAILMLFQGQNESGLKRPDMIVAKHHILNRSWFRIILAAAIGLLSGLVGIGGGIFLAPVLHLTRWRSPWRIAAISALFIFSNALAGATAWFISNRFTGEWSTLVALLLAVLVGGFIGSGFSMSQKGQHRIRTITAVLIFLVSIRILVVELIL